MSTGRGVDSADGRGLRSAVEGIVWPAILPDAGAHLLAVNFQLERSQWWSEAEMQGHQMTQLRHLLAHAVKEVSYYGRPEYRSWLDTSENEARQAFSELPLLTRRQAQEAGDSMFAEGLPGQHGGITEGQTSGSTGVPLRYRTTAVAAFFWNAIVLREHFWQGRDFSAHHAFIRSRTPVDLSPTWGPPSNMIFACGESANLPANSSLEKRHEWLLEMDPHYLMTTPSILRSLAERAIEGVLPLQRLRETRTVGETVTASLRELVRRAWGVEVTDSYSSSECGLLALQCPESGRYHVQSEWAVVEVLDARGQPCLPGEVGRVVVTPIHNFAMPLVRYDTGDYAEVGEPCVCGRGLPSLNRILGRRRNRMFLPGGGVIWPNLSSFPWQDLAPRLRKFQVLQKKDCSLLLRYESERDFLRDERDRLVRALLDYLRCTLPICFERVDGLPTSDAGKLEDFITEIVPEVDA